MRLRIERKIRKQLRRTKLEKPVARLERTGRSLTEALRSIALDASSIDQVGAAKLLGEAGDRAIVPALLELFCRQTGKDDTYQTALVLERMNDRRAVAPLIGALGDSNFNRRRGAARALGWMNRPGRAAALALGTCLVDPSQPKEVREEAAESLAYVGIRDTVEPLIAALRDPDPSIRFWAAFGLGGKVRRDSRAIAALESVLEDAGTPPDYWWAVGKEALAMLALRHSPSGDYAGRMRREIEAILADPNASATDRRWAEQYK